MNLAPLQGPKWCNILFKSLSVIRRPLRTPRAKNEHFDPNSDEQQLYLSISSVKFSYDSMPLQALVLIVKIYVLTLAEKSKHDQKRELDLIAEFCTRRRAEPDVDHTLHPLSWGSVHDTINYCVLP